MRTILPALLAVPLALLPAVAQKEKPPPRGKDAALKLFAEEFVPLTPGAGKFPASFKMGTADGPDEEKPVHSVKLARPFAIAKYEVTQELYQAVMGKNPSKWTGPRNSVEMVSWKDANEFCKKATLEMRKRKLLKEDEVIRLPTEAEWEYACRAGTATAYSFGGGSARIGDYCWFKGNSKGYDPPVGSKKPNPWGLYDMHGYVWEWVADSWHPGYKGAPADGSARADKDAKQHVIRGGSWNDIADNCRSASRAARAADFRSDTVGFRCVRAPRVARGGRKVEGKVKADSSPSTLHPPPSTREWPQFLGPKRDGHSSENGLARSFPRKGPPVVWEKKVGEGFAGPVVAGGRLILFHRVGDKDTVECLRATTGKVLWTFAYETEYRDRLGKGDGPRSTPLVAGKHVYTLAADGRLHCLELEGGKKVWARDLNKDYRVQPSFFGVTTSPLIEGDKLVLNVGGTGGIVALDRATGKEVWKATADDASNASPVAATLAGKRTLVFFTRTGLVLLDPAKGKVLHQKRWRARINASVNAATPVVVGDEIFISACYDTGGTVLKVTKDGLESRWANDESLSNHFSTSVYHKGQLYGFHGRQEEGTQFRCVDWATGKVRWSKEDFGCGAILVADGLLLVLSESGDLVLVEPTPASYRAKARAKVLDSPVRAAPALAGGLLYARDNKKLVCWDLKAVK